MNQNQKLIDQLKKILYQKKGKSHYAQKLGVTEEKITELYKQIGKETHTPVPKRLKNVTASAVKYEENIEEGLGEIVFNTDEEIKSLEDLIKKSKIDTDKWNITKYIQNYWGNVEHPSWQVKAWLSKKEEEQIFQEHFVKFLTTYKPSAKKVIAPKRNEKIEACLIINKQDSHLNKLDIEEYNRIDWRGSAIEQKVEIIIAQAKLSNDLKIIKYIIGSDEFNSEWTGMTTKGTPQQNTDDYQKSFEEICNHEIDMINLLLRSAEYVEVIYIPGNHDEYAGWHLISWLAAYFRNDVADERISFDTDTNYRKYVSFGSTAMMFNHGDAIKPSKLASLFPMEFREEWSYFDHFYIFTGDKHHELSQDFNGIKFYQIPAFSKAKGKWDDKHGYTCSKGEVTAFLIEMSQGMTNIFKQYL